MLTWTLSNRPTLRLLNSRTNPRLSSRKNSRASRRSLTSFASSTLLTATSSLPSWTMSESRLLASWPSSTTLSVSSSPSCTRARSTSPRILEPSKPEPLDKDSLLPSSMLRLLLSLRRLPLSPRESLPSRPKYFDVQPNTTPLRRKKKEKFNDPHACFLYMLIF